MPRPKEASMPAGKMGGVGSLQKREQRERLTSDETTADNGKVKKIRLNFAFAAVQAHATCKI
jgi:hypothetical protein